MSSKWNFMLNFHAILTLKYFKIFFISATCEISYQSKTEDILGFVYLLYRKNVRNLKIRFKKNFGIEFL